ncbi:hypothetical protein ACWDSJ_37845, partial [Nocardia sp. NPDC003482]
DEVVSIGSLSKILWGGLRIGWIRAPAALIARPPSCPPRPRPARPTRSLPWAAPLSCSAAPLSR